MIGILPAAGTASRFSGLPKFLLPVSDGTLLGVHCERMIRSGVDFVAIGASNDTVDLIHRYSPQKTIVYKGGETMAETVINARSFADDEPVLFGMPDTYWASPLMYLAIRDLLSKCDVAVACWKIRPEQRGKLGQCDVIDDYVVHRVIDKDPDCRYSWAWGAIAWKPAFWDFIKPTMSTVGKALQSAIDAGLQVRASTTTGDYFDCGTFDEYARCIRETTEVAHATI